MPVQDFALDPTATYRVQTHWSTEDKPATVLLNGSILGSLNTPVERTTGKDFTLPDGSPLHVQFANNQPQAFRYGLPLAPVVAATNPKSTHLRYRSAGFTTWLVLRLVFAAIALLINLFSAFAAVQSGFLPLSLILVVVDAAIITAIIALFYWKKWGFYLLVATTALDVLLDLALFFLFQQSSGLFYAFLSVAWLVLIYSRLNRSNIWDMLD